MVTWIGIGSIRRTYICTCTCICDDHLHVLGCPNFQNQEKMPGEKLPLLARAVGGRVLGPRPGKAIVSFWQGIVEIVLRSVALVGLPKYKL